LPPTRIVLVTLFRRALIRLTVPESSLLAQTERSPKASAYGERPTRIRAYRRFVRALIRVTRAANREPHPDAARSVGDRERLAVDPDLRFHTPGGWIHLHEPASGAVGHPEHSGTGADEGGRQPDVELGGRGCRRGTAAGGGEHQRRADGRFA
jgi:hypothetical protein